MKVAIALSGGIDSSIAAYLLKNSGYDLIGSTMIIYPTSRCCSEEAINDAYKISKFLNIPFKQYNLINEFKNEIIDYFLNSYLNAQTPNPCPLCNVKFKFGLLWNNLKKDFNTDYIATGHYAIVNYNKELKRFQLFKGIDSSKDQSYMLYGLTQEQLSYCLFPLGKTFKKDNKLLAKKIGLPIVDKKESQDVCFNDGNTSLFLKKHLQDRVKEGDIIDINGKKLGTHKGIIYYTIGQRKGLGISYKEPLYVIKIDPINNNIVVGTKEQLYSRELLATNFNWVSLSMEQFIKANLKVQVKIRYSSEPATAEVIIQNRQNLKIIFDTPQMAITPGQIAVLYYKDMLIGGGVIQLY